MLSTGALLSRPRPCTGETSMEHAPGCHRYLSNAFYRRAMCAANPGPKTDILYHRSTVAGQTQPLPPLLAKKTSFRCVLMEGAGDYVLISLLNGRDGTLVHFSSKNRLLHCEMYATNGPFLKNHTNSSAWTFCPEILVYRCRYQRGSRGYRAFYSRTYYRWTLHEGRRNSC